MTSRAYTDHYHYTATGELRTGRGMGMAASTLSTIAPTMMTTCALGSSVLKGNQGW